MNRYNNGNTGNLLIIDDEPEILKSLRRQFRRKYNTYLANTAQEAEEIMKETPIQVIISDQRMPSMSGAEFFAKVKGDYPDAIRLLLTGYSDIEALVKAINDGNIYRYITKPWDPTELDVIVAQAFERYDLMVQNRRLLRELKESNILLEERVAERTAALVETNRRLEEINVEKDRFIGMIAHDLRTPISGIWGMSSLLADPEIEMPTEDRLEFGTAMHRAAQNMLDLVNDLLDITRIQSGRIELRLKETDMADYLTEIVRFVRRIGERKNIELVMDLEPDLPPITIDPLRIQQVLHNLISNAFKFSHTHTTVTVKLRQSEGQYVISVIDQGQGIKASEIDKVFSELPRVSTKPTAGEPSTGLGLAICKRIVALHGGQITVESEWGQGSCFCFTLPAD